MIDVLYLYKESLSLASISLSSVVQFSSLSAPSCALVVLFPQSDWEMGDISMLQTIYIYQNNLALHCVTTTTRNYNNMS